MEEKILSINEIQKIIQDNMETILKFTKNSEYLRKNYEKIKKKYAGKYILIMDKEIKEVDKKLLQELKAKNKLAEAFITYIPRKNEVFIL